MAQASETVISNKSSFHPESIKRILGEPAGNISVPNEFLIGPLESGNSNNYTVSMWQIDQSKIKTFEGKIEYKGIGIWKIKAKIEDWAEYKKSHNVMNLFMINVLKYNILVEWDDNKFPVPICLFVSLQNEIFTLEVFST
jgi:hypothetical protein